MLFIGCAGSKPDPVKKSEILHRDERKANDDLNESSEKLNPDGSPAEEPGQLLELIQGKPELASDIIDTWLSEVAHER